MPGKRAIVVREASYDDYEAIERVARSAFGERDLRWAASALWWCDVLVAEVGGNVAGFVEYYLTRLGRLRLGAIYYIAVERRFRRQGVASELLRRAEEDLELSGADLLAASTRRGNVASKRLFSKRGYVILDVNGVPRAEIYSLLAALYSLEDDVLMVKPVTPEGVRYVDKLLGES